MISLNKAGIFNKFLKIAYIGYNFKNIKQWFLLKNVVINNQETTHIKLLIETQKKTQELRKAKAKAVIE